MKELINIIAFSALFGQIYMNITCYESDLEQFSYNSFVSFRNLFAKTIAQQIKLLFADLE